MKKSILLLIAVMTISISFAQIQRSAKSKSNSLELIVKSNSKTINESSIKNEKNPFEKIGIEHNAFLNYFITYCSTKNVQKINRKILIIIYQDYLSRFKKPKNDKEIKNFSKIIDVYSTLFKANKKWYNQDSKGDICKYIPTICEVFKEKFPMPELPLTFLMPETGGSQYDKTMMFIESIKLLENMISNDKSLNENQKKLLYSTYTVARHSAAYWYNNLITNQETSIWIKHFKIDPKKMAGTADCISCDVLGGDASGAAVGVFVGGIGAGPGAAIGSAAVALEHGIRALIEWW